MVVDRIVVFLFNFHLFVFLPLSRLVQLINKRKMLVSGTKFFKLFDLNISFHSSTQDREISNEGQDSYGNFYAI